MDPKRLLIFAAVAREGSIAAAARTLGWTQPAVGQHLKALEREVGGPLVVRGARGVALTPAGRTLRVHAEALAARLRAADDELADLAALRTGTVRVAAFPSACATFVPAAMARLAHRHPGLDVVVTVQEPMEALDLLRDGQVDVAVVFRHPGSPVEQAPEMVEDPVAPDPVRVVVPAAHPAATDPGAGLADLAGQRWAGGCPRCREHLVAVCAAAGFRPDIRHSTDDHHVVQAMVAHGLAVALLPGLALRAFRHPGVAVLDEPAGHRAVGVVRHREAVASPGPAALVTELLAAAARP